MRKVFVLACVLLLCGSSLSWAQSVSSSSGLESSEPFVDSYVYSVPGTLLNAWRVESIAQARDFAKASEALANANRSFATVSNDLSELRISFALYKRKMCIAMALEAGAAFLAGSALGYALAQGVR
jgi:hypothetical protein